MHALPAGGSSSWPATMRPRSPNCCPDPPPSSARRRFAATARVSERRRAFEGLTALLRGLSERAPVLLSLDDVQNAGRSSLELLHYLARHAPNARDPRGLQRFARKKELTSSTPSPSVADIRPARPAVARRGAQPRDRSRSRRPDRRHHDAHPRPLAVRRRDAAGARRGQHRHPGVAGSRRADPGTTGRTRRRSTAAGRRGPRRGLRASHRRGPARAAAAGRSSAPARTRWPRGCSSSPAATTSSRTTWSATCSTRRRRSRPG